ncbi:hypothetical protein O4H52_19440 [Sphingomonadaceae bacterium G21617-S1]|nr:hypothetical protein [Sphingomonadaceae bacterium G21617-S1]
MLGSGAIGYAARADEARDGTEPVREIDDFTDERQKALCIHCGAVIADIESNRDHVPTKSLLTKGLRERGADYDRGEGGEFDYLPQVVVCRQCNSGFSPDENYFLCVLHAVMAGSLYPDPAIRPEASGILRSNRHVVRSLKKGPDGQLLLFDDLQPFTLFPDTAKVRNVIVKNARGHAYHEIGEPLLDAPSHVAFVPLEQLDPEQREAFESAGTPGELAVWPEVGSRMTVHLLDDQAMVGGWITVEPGRYRYAIDWAGDVIVKTVIWEYLATETRWER